MRSRGSGAHGCEAAAFRDFGAIGIRAAADTDIRARVCSRGSGARGCEAAAFRDLGAIGIRAAADTDLAQRPSLRVDDEGVEPTGLPAERAFDELWERCSLEQVLERPLRRGVADDDDPLVLEPREEITEEALHP